ncbi:MAG: 50S ribosomal protein L18e [Nanoarchaeota archaeon]|nr:50S ribosomal protein L18e [Nanoarchaeota archaeon]
MKASKTTIKQRADKKTNPELKLLVDALKKSNFWMDVAYWLTRPTREMPEVNLEKLSKETKEGEIVVVPGKVLANGEMKHKITLAAFMISNNAKEKMKGSKIVTIKELMESNKDGRGVKIIV